MFWCMEKRGVGGDIIRKFTFECGSGPAGTAGIYKILEVFSFVTPSRLNRWTYMDD